MVELHQPYMAELGHSTPAACNKYRYGKNKNMAVQIQLRRGTSTEWSNVNPILAPGEIAVETNTRKIKLGDGTSPWNSLEYSGADSALAQAGYDQANTGTTLAQNAYATANLGYSQANTSTTLAQAAYDKANTSSVDLSMIMEDVLPAIGSVYDIGSATNSWYNGYFTNAVNLGDDISITADESFSTVFVDREVVDEFEVVAPWVSDVNLNTARFSHAGAGTQDAALAFGGFNSYPGGGSSDQSSTEEYNGTSWSFGGNLNTVRYDHAGAGTQDAALAFGGFVTGVGRVTSTEEYNGTSWSSGGNLITARFRHAGAGTQDAALAIGGNDNSANVLSLTEEYNGTSWASGGNLISARESPASAGTQDAALAFGGLDITRSNTLTSTEEYNGTSWSFGGNLNTARYEPAGAGTQDAALAIGGAFRSTEEYDGTGWSFGGNLITARFSHAGAGTQDAALAFGGVDSDLLLSSTEKYNRTITINTVITTVTDEVTIPEPLLNINADLSAKDIIGSSLLLNDIAIVDNVITPLSTPLYGDRQLIIDGNLNVEGTSKDTGWIKVPVVESEIIGLQPGAWSTGGNLSSGRNLHAGTGTQDAALAFGGGRDDSVAFSTEEYDGTSWSSGGNLIVNRSDPAGAGTQDAALAFGGQGGGTGMAPGSTEEYNGTSWASGGNLITGRAGEGAGTQDAALAFGGFTTSGVILSSTEEYDGTSWSSGGNLITGRDNHAGAGTQDAALAFGGFASSVQKYLSSMEEYDGTSWSTGGNLNIARRDHAGAGTQDAALAIGGAQTFISQPSGVDVGESMTSTEEYDGTSWSFGGNLSIAKKSGSSAGTQNAGLSVGGVTFGSVRLSLTEEYNKLPIFKGPTTEGQPGSIRFNKDTNSFESNDGAKWESVQTGPATVFADNNNFNVTTTLTPVNEFDQGSDNNFFGNYAGCSNTTGRNNNFFGACAGRLNTTGFFNNFIGTFAGRFNSTGCDNNFIGSRAGYNNTSGFLNNFIGRDAGRDNTTGAFNNFFGAYAGRENTTGRGNNFSGREAGQLNTTGSYNNFFGAGAGRFNSTGCDNNFIGSRAGYSNTTGSYNNFFGTCAGCDNTTGSNNNFFGTSAGRLNTTGTHNNFFGACAGRSNTTGYNNNFISTFAGCCNTTGCCNNFFGAYAGCRNTTGFNNNFFGASAGRLNTTGSHNNFFGAGAGCRNTTGCNNILIGCGTGQNATWGLACITTESNRIILGNCAHTCAQIQVAWTVVSDARDKCIFGSVPHGRGFLEKINPIEFAFKDRTTNEITDPEGKRRYGFSAQEVLAAEGENAVIVSDDNPEKLQMTNDYLIPILVNAVKELSEEVDSLKLKVKLLIESGS
jgi:hypothetical protein